MITSNSSPLAEAAIEVIEQVDQTIKVHLPKMYKVVLHNDDTTTVAFVMQVLMRIFHRTAEDAYTLTHTIHETGQGIAGAPYTKEVAEEKAIETATLARANKFPLVATFEEV